MKRLKNLLIAGGLSLILSNCPLPYEPVPSNEPTPTSTPKPDYFTEITFEVEGSDAFGKDITYGDEKYCDCNDSSKLRWICTGVNPPLGQCANEDSPCTTSSSSQLWSYTYSTCKGHPVKLSSTAAGNSGENLTLRIKQDGNLVAQKKYDSNGFLWSGDLEYSIPSQ